MAQFDVYRVRGGGLVIDCQSDLLDNLPTRFVVPLRAEDASVMRRFNPVFQVEGRNFAMVTQLAGAIAARDILSTVASVASQEYQIKAALDMLIVGF